MRGGRAEEGSQHLLPLQGFWGGWCSEDKGGKGGEKRNDMERQNRSIKRGERRELAKGNKTRPLTLTAAEGRLGIQTIQTAVLQGESMGDRRGGGVEEGSAARAGERGSRKDRKAGDEGGDAERGRRTERKLQRGMWVKTKYTDCTEERWGRERAGGACWTRSTPGRPGRQGRPREGQSGALGSRAGPEEVEGDRGVHSRAWTGGEGASPARQGGASLGSRQGPGQALRVQERGLRSAAAVGKQTGAWRAVRVQGKGLRSREGSGESQGDPRGPLTPGSAGRGLGEEAQGSGWAPAAA